MTARRAATSTASTTRTTSSIGAGSKVSGVPRCRRAGVYLRMSKDNELGIARQKKGCLERAAEIGWDVTVIYTDNDSSASSEKVVRKDYQRMLGDLRAGVIDAVIVWDLDRLTRRPIETEEFIALADKHDVALASVDRDVDLSTDNGRLFARIKGAVARAEVERKGARQKARNRQAAEAGEPFGGTRPFGYQDDHRTLNRAEAKEVRWAMKQILRGESIYEIARSWNRRGIKPVKAERWTNTAVRACLLKARNAGIRTYLGEEMETPGKWTPIVDVDTWRAVKTLLDDPSRKQGPGNKPKYLLSGMGRCGVEGCTHTLKTKTSRDGSGVTRTLYSCRVGASFENYTGDRGGHVYRRADYVDKYVRDVFVEWLQTDDAKDLIREDENIDVTALHDRQAVLRTKLDQYADEETAGDLTMSQLKRMTRTVRDELEQIETTLAVAARTSPLVDLVARPDAEERWDALSLGTRRALIDTLMVVTVLPKIPGSPPSGFDPRSVRIDWKY